MVLLIFAISCSNNGNTNDDTKYNINGVSISKKNKQVTTRGATIYSSNMVDSAFLNNVDSGLSLAFNNAVISGWTKNMDYQMYIVYIPVNPCTPSPEQGVASFQVESGNSSPYNGSIYDQHNTKGLETDPIRLSQNYKWKADDKTIILASEMVITQNESQMEMIVCNGPESLNGSQYGAEHYLAAYNDADYYNLTLTHLTRSHPILPKPIEFSQQRTLNKSEINTGVVINLVK